MPAPFQIRKILFPTDFSSSSERTANHAMGLAKALSAEVWVLHVVPWMGAWHGASEVYFDISANVIGSKLEEGQQAAEKSAAERLTRFQKEHFDGISTPLSVRRGGVAETVVEYAEEIQADLIMMSTRGWGLVRPFLIGSAAAKILHDARCSVWISPHIQELEDFHPYRHVLCATDYRVLNPNLPVRGAEIARLFHATLGIASAVHCPAASSQSCPEHPSVLEIKRATTATLKRVLSESNIAGSIHVHEGTEGEVVRHAALVENADLIVIGHGRLEEQMGHLRTRAYEIIWNAPCPVLVLSSSLLRA